MPFNKSALVGTVALTVALAACAPEPEPAQTTRIPIYAKDGTIVRYETRVVNQNDTDVVGEEVPTGDERTAPSANSSPPDTDGSAGGSDDGDDSDG